ncbi:MULTISPECIES: NADP-dependent oxidoreductase [unclassified Curtobacterium]|uniref:NADP-dependent oxidoreductase n=1 Tax=unclassified Curtobacterium TaxID=257496 RepID=UPI000DAA6CFA|nr:MULTISPECIES: NADP-dependent oxidoreductase [unclassified Curtobacterium]PZE25663.1 NADP-dependent oxidoreductase [Curtobacterium sp. MCBD17_028]PZE78469.1 NADP-dependent oxidoreductase [Curtobacterium sp. MCBD17_019]
MRVGSAVEFDRYGGTDELHFVDQERPTPADGEVVVEVVAAGLSHIEIATREGALADRLPTVFPSRQGSCFAGIVRAKGRSVRGVHAGQAVMGHAVGGGAQASWVCVPAAAIVRKPENIPFEVAGGLYLAGTTAWRIIDDLAITADDVVVIAAAAGGVGHIEAQLALAAGARVIGTCGERNHDYLRQIGVLPVTYGDGMVERIRQAAAGHPVTAFVDNRGDGAALSTALGVDPARFVSLERRRDVELHFVQAGGDDTDPATIMQDLGRRIEAHQLRVLVSGFYPFEYLVDAYEDLAAGHSRGKVVVGMQPVETGMRQEWYRSEKARTMAER